MINKITFRTAAGNLTIPHWERHYTIHQICQINKIPYQSINIFLKINQSSRYFVGMFYTIEQIEDIFDNCVEVVLYSNSNSNYNNLISKKVNIQGSNNSVTEYSFPSGQILSKIEHIEFSEDDCNAYVKNDIIEFLKKFTNLPVESEKINLIIGVSGGGDSNALLTILHEISEIFNFNLIPVMVRNIPGTDLGYDRIKEICKSYNLGLLEINNSEVNKLLGRKSNSDWLESFMNNFPNSDIEIIATLVIRLALFDICKRFNSRICITGVNLEDILAECYLRAMQGKLPNPFPIREIGEYQIWFPLYRTPKKIIDGCFPKFSFENYNERIPNEIVGRDICLYFAQRVSEISSGLEFDFIQGFQELSKLNTSPFYYEKNFKMYFTEKVPSEVLEKWNIYLND